MKSEDLSNYDEIKEIDERLKEYKYGYMMYIRISVVKMVIKGCSRGEAASKFNVHRKSAENWVKAYNRDGFSGLEPNYSNCGLKCKLSDSQLKELKYIVTKSGVDYDVKSVRELIKNKFNVSYSHKQTWFILMRKLGLKYDGNKLTV